MAQGVINDYKSHGVAYGPGINSAESFLAYMNALKQTNPSLYNQLMSNPTIRQAMQYAQAYINYANAFVNWHLNPNPTMTTQQFGLTTANNLMTQINQLMQSGNYQQALQYAQMLKTLAQQYGLPINTQSLNTLINELTILSRLPQAPNVQPPRMSPQLMRALARSEPGYYTSMANVYYQNAYRQWMQYYNELTQLANQAQSMGLTDLASRLRAQASVANQVAQGYLTNYVLTSPNVTSFINTLNQYIQLLRNQPDPTTNPQAYLAWLGEVVAMSQQVRNTWQSVYPFLSQYQNVPQIQQLIQQGQYAQQVSQQVMQYANQQLQPFLLANPSILNVTPTSLTQLGGLGGVLTSSALMQSLVQLPPGTQIQIPYTPLTTQQGQRRNEWWSGLANWYQSQLQLARQMATSSNPLLRAIGGAYLGTLTLGSGAVGFAENFGALATGFPGTMLVGLAEMPLVGARTTMGPRSPVTQFLLGVGVPLAQTSEFLQSSANWTLQQAQQAWQGIAPQTTITIPGWARPITPLIEAFYPYVSNGRLVVSPGTVIGAVGYNLPLVLSGVGAIGGAAKGVGLGMAGEETLAGELSPELSTRLGMWLAERAPWLARTLPRLGLTSERLIGLGSTLERVGAVGNLIDPYAWLGRLTGELLAGGGELAARLGGRLERYALGGLAGAVGEGTPEFYMLPRYLQYATALRNIGLDLLGATGTTLARVGGLAQVIGRPLAEAFPMPWEYYTYRQLFGEVGPLGRAAMPLPRPLTQELMDYLRGVRYVPFRFSFPLVIASPEVFAPYTLGARTIGRTAFEAGTGTITGIERFGWEIPIVYGLPDGSKTGVTLVARVSEDGSTAVLTVPTITEGGRVRWTQLTVPVNRLEQTVRDIAQRLAVQLKLPPGATPIFNVEPLYLFRIGTNVPGLGELTAFLTPQQLRQYRLLVGASQAFMPNELAEMLGLTANANQVEALRNAYYTLLASLLGQPPEVLERNPNLVLALGGGLATQYMRGLSPALVSDIMARTGRTPASLFYEWFQNVLPYIQQAQRSIIAPGVGIFGLTSGVAPFGRVYAPYAFGLAEIPIGTRLLTETLPGSEVVGTGALLRTPEGLVVPGAGQLLGLSPTQLMGRLTLLNIDPYTLMAMLSQTQQQLERLGITYLPFRAVTEFGTPLYTRAGTIASTNLLADWVRALMSAPYRLITPTELGELGTMELYPYIARLTPGEAEALAESMTAARGVPTGAAGIMALPQGVEVGRATPLTLEDLLSSMETTGAGRYLSALVGLRLAEEAGATPIAELIPELARVGARAVSPTIAELQRQRRPVLPTIPGAPQIELPWFLPPGLRQWGGNLLTFSWYGPGRINVSPPGVLELLRALYPTGTQAGTRQYYTQVSTPTLNPPTIAPPLLPPITIQGQTTTGTGQGNPPLNPPTTATPIPPTATPPIPPFLIPLLWFPSWMPQQYPLPSELARPGAMREILVL
jgi:protein involved in ribonucleotide reduction